MESRENNQKNVLLSVLGVAILVVAVVGISFAAYSGSNTGGVNKVSTGNITFSYAEPTSGITLSNAASITDTAGKALTNKFDFTVTTTTNGALTIPYDVTLTKVTGNTLGDDMVKVYVTKNSDKDVVKDVTKVSALSSYTRGEDTTNTKLLFSSSHAHTSASTVATNYSFRMWVSQDATLTSSSSQTFKALINVDSTVSAQ